jgi:hypothetical protein
MAEDEKKAIEQELAASWKLTKVEFYSKEGQLQGTVRSVDAETRFAFTPEGRFQPLLVVEGKPTSRLRDFYESFRDELTTKPLFAGFYVEQGNQLAIWSFEVDDHGAKAVLPTVHVFTINYKNDQLLILVDEDGHRYTFEK